MHTCVAHYHNLSIDPLVVSGLPVGVHTRIFRHHGGTTCGLMEGGDRQGAGAEETEDRERTEEEREKGGETEKAKESLFTRLRMHNHNGHVRLSLRLFGTGSNDRLHPPPGAASLPVLLPLFSSPSVAPTPVVRTGTLLSQPPTQHGVLHIQMTGM
ncbi:hypothetical protein NUW54_g6795 [Trametes sanguinea]|uniref:Uncharacterized protein n=1 Tax=Trametes sanguinea TaxID=158606 RepID=A0ACC1PR78_9APHY|nr:hypothetical protein NUW54_g6795 [Trametes sanguinea]